MNTIHHWNKFVWLPEILPIWIWACIKWWNITENHFRQEDKLPVVDFRAMTEKCPHDCFHCFTNKIHKTLTLDEIKNVIDQLAAMWTKSIDYLWEGEPTIDDNFFEIVEYTSKKWIQPIIFTDWAARLRDRDFVRRLKNTWASVMPKCDSLWDWKYQNWIVRDYSWKFFDQRNEALKLLIEEGFNEVNEDWTTRLWFDVVVSAKNIHEVEKTLRFCRENNIFIMFAFFLPSWRSSNNDFEKSLIVSNEEKSRIKELVRKIDEEEFWFIHHSWNNFLTVSCVERLQIRWDWKVTPCPWVDTVIWDVRHQTISDINRIIINKYSELNPLNFDWNCPYRAMI